MDKADLPDHAIAHTIQQKQIETQNLMKVVEINEFFEEEKLETGDNVPKLKPVDLIELPTKEFTLNPEPQDDKVKQSCMVCMCEFEEGQSVRTIRCLHMFHTECIDKWLLERTGTCPICKTK